MEKNRIKKSFLIGLTIAMLTLTFLSAAQPVDAFRIGKYDVGLGGISKLETEKSIEKGTPTQEKERLTNTQIAEAIREANRDRHASRFMKSGFADQKFCVRTEERVAYLNVDSGGRLSLMGSKPDKCYEIQTSEQALKQTWNEYEAGKKVSYSTVKQRFDLPFKVKARAALAWTFG